MGRRIRAINRLKTGTYEHQKMGPSAELKALAMGFIVKGKLTERPRL